MLNLQSSEHITTPVSFTSNLKKPPVPVNSFTELTAAQTTLTITRNLWTLRALEMSSPSKGKHLVDSTSGSNDLHFSSWTPNSKKILKKIYNKKDLAFTYYLSS
jgi:hypothetical protein